MTGSIVRWRRSAADSMATALRCFAILLGAGVLALGATGCSDGGLPPGSANVRVSEGRRDASVSMTGTLHVELVGHAGTGYEWRLKANDPSLFEPIGNPHITPVDPGVMGGRTVTTYQFRPLRTGKATIVFEYVRPFDPNEPPGKIAQIEATVTGGG